MAPIRIYLFGVPRCEREHAAIHITRRKTMALLAYLVVNARPLSRDALAAMFWPDYDQSSARANLRRDLSRVKEVVGEAALDTDRSQISLDPQAGIWLDVSQFEHLIETLHDHTGADGRVDEQGMAAAAQAADLYSTGFMTGFSLPDSSAFEDWQFFQAESLRQSMAEALQTLIAGHTQAGEFERAIEPARRWLALDPLNEPAHRSLMKLYAWAGMHTRALRQYQECAQLLMSELGMGPEPETVELYKQIRARQLTPPVVDRLAAAQSDPLPRPEERFVEEALLAVGGQGEVYRGRDLLTGQAVVIKRLKPDLIDSSPHRVSRFIREGETLRQLNHPNIVALLGTFERSGRPSLVMEYAPQGTLRDLLRQNAQLPVERVLQLALELADALARAHHMGVIHRDVKPDNVLLAEDGTPRLTDFGMARLLRENTRMTESGAIVGSPVYMSPEAVRGQEMDARADIWSFGVMLYEMLAGSLPFDDTHLTPLVLKILNDDVPDLLHFRPDTPPALALLIERMLVKDREQRLGSMRQAAAELEAIQLEVNNRPADTPEISTATGGQAEQEIRFCTARDGVRIAYATVGNGPPLVKVANWMSHLEYDWNSPVWRHWLEGLSARHTLVRYDMRGCGLSDWDVGEFSHDAYVSDLEAVMEALGLERFPLLALSGGGPIAIEYAARHPEKVSHLILYGSYAKGRFKRGVEPEHQEIGKTELQLIKTGWGQDNPAYHQFFTTLFMPEASSEQMRWFNDLQRVSTSPENAYRLEESFFYNDVSHLLAQIQAPTLVLHANQDGVVPVDAGRALASRIPQARFVLLNSKNHILLNEESAWRRFLEEVERFLYEPGA